jgi:unsaturated rhamnogalacturonyl hydrolase
MEDRDLNTAAGSLDPGRAAGLALASSLMSRYGPGNAAWHYEHGLFLMAARAAGKAFGDESLAASAERMMGLFVEADGSLRSYRGEDFNLDQVNPGRNLFFLLGAAGDGRYRIAIETLRGQLRSQPRTPSGGFWHKRIYPNQMWLDGLYMAGPFYARYAKEFDEPAIFDDVVRQFSLVDENGRDPRTGLLYHAWDESRKQLWANPETGCSPQFWGRALGWLAMAIVDVLDWIPDDHMGRRTLVVMMSRLAKALIPWQDEGSGLWWQVLDQPEREGNYLETSATAMIAYSLMKAIRSGDLSEGAYGPAAERAYRGLVAARLHRVPRDARVEGDAVGDKGMVRLDGTCSVAGLGGSPYRDGSFDYYVNEPVKSDDFKGCGPFILASIEYELRKKGR